jgi:hypothetical protein
MRSPCKMVTTFAAAITTLSIDARSLSGLT